MRIDESIIKVRTEKAVPEGYTLYPYCIIPFLPPLDCVFDSYRGTIGFDVFPFAITTRISASSEVFLKVYVED